MWQRDGRQQHSAHKNTGNNYRHSSGKGLYDDRNPNARTYDGRRNSFERFHRPDNARESNQRNAFQDQSIPASRNDIIAPGGENTSHSSSSTPFMPSNFPQQNNMPHNFLAPKDRRTLNMGPSIPFENFSPPNMEQNNMGPPMMPPQNIAPPIIMPQQNFGMANMEQNNMGSPIVPQHLAPSNVTNPNIGQSNTHHQNMGPPNMQYRNLRPPNMNNQNMLPPNSEKNMGPPNMVPPVFMNVPPPGFNNTSIPPPGFQNTNVPPDFLKAQMPPPDGRLMGGSMLPPVSIPPPPPVMVSQGMMPMNANQQSMFQGFDSTLVNDDNTTRALDQQWVNTFLEQRKLTKKMEIEKPKVGEAKEMLQKWFKTLGKVEAQRDKLTECIKSGDSEWQRELQKANLLTEELEQVEMEFSAHFDMEGLLKEVVKKRKKKEWQKRRRKTLALQKQETEKKQYELHLQIDQWREKEMAKDQAKFKDASIKKEAGGVLGEVRRKQGDSRQAIGLLKALNKLRSFRKQEAEVKGVYQRPTTEQTKDFERRIECMEKLMIKHHELYESEEKTLSVMLAEEEEEKERERREKKHTRQLQEAAAASDSSDPMREFYRYYTQAENGLDSLIHIRHGWDMYIVPDSVPGASSIPQGNVSPCAPSSNQWAAYVKDDG